MHAYMHIYANKNLHICCITDEYMHKSYAHGKYFMYFEAIDSIYYLLKGMFYGKNAQIELCKTIIMHNNSTKVNFLAKNY